MKQKKQVTVKACELLDGDVQLISMVGRPANRIPYGLMKSEKGDNQMFDLNLANLFKSEQKQAAPVVTAVLVKGEASTEMLAVLKEQGFLVDEVQKTDEGVSVYPQEHEYRGEVTLVKLTEDVALAVPMVKAAGSFAEMAAAHGFYPSINIATDLLQCELHRAIEKSDSPNEAATRVGELLSDFGGYMQTMVKGLPAIVFKTEQALGSATVEETAEASTEEVEKSAKSTKSAPAKATDEEDEDEKAMKKAEESSEEASDDEGDVEKSEDEDDTLDTGIEKSEETSDDEGTEDATEVEKQEEQGEAPAAPAVDTDAIVKAVTAALQPQLDELRKSVSETGAKVEKAEEVLGQPLGNVFGTTDRSEELRKSEPVGPSIDTGLRPGK